jgi:hypothetical protein
MGPEGPYWLTIPIRRPAQLSTPIDRIVVATRDWNERHLKSFKSSLGSRPYWTHYEAQIFDAYRSIEREERLSEINVFLLRVIMSELNIKTPLFMDRSFGTLPNDANARIISLCKELEADTYITGPAGLNYIQLRAFQLQGISVKIFSYPSYGPYDQISGDFSSRVSVLDFLANNSIATITKVLNDDPIIDAKQCALDD